MGVNRGKNFERVIKDAFLKVPGVSIDRLHDQTNGYAGSWNICDFIVYKKPYEYYIECKSVKGASLPFANITDNQWSGLLEKSHIPGVCAGIICWFIDKDVTKFIPIQALQAMKIDDMKSVKYSWDNYVASYYIQNYPIIEMRGKKKRIFFDYDMTAFFEEVNAKCLNLI